ncbi:MAG: MFS transporter, partial [Firmicutes bacterium]|nr:MFS transporter [Bacillota bacterium]
MNKEQKYTLLVAITTAFLTTFMGSALNLSIPGIEEHFGVSAASVGWVVTAYILAVSAFNVPMGKIADTKGRRLVLLLGLAIFTVGSLGAAFSVSIAMLIILRMIQGLG